jgi:hypothetical protein
VGRWDGWHRGAVGAVALGLPAAALGVTDPRRWPASGWAADVIPHMVYGLVTAVAFDVAVGADGLPARRR